MHNSYTVTALSFQGRNR